MIDCHCHILPGIDDGASDIAESVAMARLAFADGISKIVATPHVTNASFFAGRHCETGRCIESAFERMPSSGWNLSCRRGFYFPRFALVCEIHHQPNQICACRVASRLFSPLYCQPAIMALRRGLASDYCTP